MNKILSRTGAIRRLWAQKKTSVMPVFCIVFLQLSLLNFSLCLVAVSRLSQILLYVRTMNICIFLSFLFIVCLFSSEGVRAVAAPFFRKCGENVAYRMLSFTLTHIPIAAIAANRLIIIVISIFLKPFLSFFSILNHLHNHLSIPSFN